MLSALAGVILTSRLYSAQPTAGSGYELDAIAAVVLGGTSLSGGVGKITGTVLGALIIGVLGNALKPVKCFFILSNDDKSNSYINSCINR